MAGFGFGRRKQESEQIEVRQARNTPADEKAARALLQETFDYHARVGEGEPSLTFKPHTQANYMEECISTLIYGDEGYEPARAFLAWQGKQAVGFALVRIMRDYYYSTDHYGYVEQLIVSQPARNQGVGPLLLQACYDWLKTRNINTATLKVYGPNIDALRFYEREGFKPLRYELIKHL